MAFAVPVTLAVFSLSHFITALARFIGFSFRGLIAAFDDP
jgi:hypothetical protein